ncbi:MAG TPA: hypothetical protein VML55_07665 [Planctomycetaceae bacterium]|nr:hypothetical protein [Planctomycetaceae bacterium]
MNPDGVQIGNVHAVVDDAVAGRQPYLVVAHRDSAGGYRFSGFLLKEFECRRHGLGDYLILRVFPETLEALPGIDPGLLVRGRPDRAAAPRPLPQPAVRRAAPAIA